MHGLLSNDEAMTLLVNYIKNAHPGTEVYNVAAYNDAYSLENMWTQVEGVQAKIQPFVDNAIDGVHMICYSEDPHQQVLYKRYCEFLPPITSGATEDYKKNFLALE